MRAVSPHNVQETGISPGTRSGSPIVAAEAEQVERTRRKTWSPARSEVFVPYRTDTLGRVSDHEGQFGERVGKPGGRRHVGPDIVEAPAEVLDEGVRDDDDPGGAVAL